MRGCILTKGNTLQRGGSWLSAAEKTPELVLKNRIASLVNQNYVMRPLECQESECGGVSDPQTQKI